MKQVLFVLFSAVLAADEPDTAKQTVRALIAKQDYSEALKQAQALNKRMPDDVESYGLLVDANVGLGNYKEAEAAAQWMLDLRIGKADSAGYQRIARLREAFGDLEGAYESTTLAFQRIPPHDAALRVAILAEAGRLRWLSGNAKEGEQTLKEALKLNSEYPPALETLAQMRLEEQKYTEAVELFRCSYKAAPQTRLLFAIAETLKKSGENKAADLAFIEFEQKAKAEITQTANANRELIYFYTDYGNQPAEAISLAKQELTRRHDSATLSAYAWALEHNGNSAEARRIRQQVLDAGGKASR